MPDTAALRNITDEITDFYKLLQPGDEEASKKAIVLKKQVDDVLNEKFEFGLEPQEKVNALFREKKAELEKSGSHNKDQLDALKNLKESMLRYAQSELLRKVSSAKFTKPQVDGEGDSFSIEANGQDITDIGSLVFKPGKYQVKVAALHNPLFLEIKASDNGLSFSIKDPAGLFASPSRARDAIISSTVKAYESKEYAGGTFTLTDGTVTDAKVIINALIKAGANCKIARLDTEEWSQKIKSGGFGGGGPTGHEDRPLKFRQTTIKELEVLNDRSAEHNRRLEGSSEEKKSDNAANTQKNAANVRISPT